eukprot:CAMPEP_0172328700 /NCGR_PEP_ID=MMETSP1058-20130122/60488_1 /TAXON_ID=83371 /ORGANISM="Detonula confervacea, Strain CCMP 353" /LENGTH=626 /DNA_ID=CAMNT_0013045827 /DNA_START=66 /DNA_END=1947 /DNA_ORIENTATION=+
MSTSMSPTPSPTFAFPSLVPTSRVTAKPTRTPMPTSKPTTDSPTKQPTQKPVTDSPTKEPTANPVTDSPTKEPTANPVTDSPTKQPTQKPVTDSPTKQPTQAPATLVALPKMTSVAPHCPPHYTTSTTYTAGDTIEDGLHIYQCQSPPYEEYCNIAELVETWNDNEKALWGDAWLHVSACEKLMVEDDMMDVRDDAVAVGGATEAPITTAATTSTVSATEARITCPSAYDPFKTNYIAGEQITIKCFIFQCRDVEHEMYCNAAAWDDNLLAQDDRAKEMWMDAWDRLSACVPTQGELMEEEAAMTQDFDSDHPPITNDAKKLKTVGLRGLTRGARRVEGDEFADLLESMWKNEDDDTHVVLELEEEGEQDDIIAILLDGDNNQDELIASLNNDGRERTPRKKMRGKKKSGNSKSSPIVKWVKKTKQKETRKKKEPSKKGNISGDAGKETEKTNTMTISMEPTPSPTFGFPTFDPTSIIILMDEPSTLPVTGNDMMDVRDDAVAVDGATEAPITTAATSSTMATTKAPITSETAHGQPCPSAYDPFKTNYIAGEQITIKCFIFQCRDVEHEMYCNAAAWDDNLLAQDDRAKEMWMDAWDRLSACVPTQGELMEEEAANASDAWDCLA